MKKGISLSIGVPSFIMVFIILCITVFSVLSYITAKNDASLSERTYNSIQSYYNADSQAQKKISEIDSCISDVISSNNDKDNFYFSLKQKLQYDDSIVISETDGKTIVSFSVEVDDVRAINVSLTVYQNINERYSVNAYNLIYTGEWDGDNKHIEVFEE